MKNKANRYKKWNIVMRTQGKNINELKDAIYSVVCQSYPNKSIILIVHSDKDSNIKKVKKLLIHFEGLVEIKSFVRKKKQGVRSYPINEALKQIDGDYVSFLDDDDVYYPYMGDLLIKKMDKYSFAYGASIQASQKKNTDFSGGDYLYTESKVNRYCEHFNKLKLFIENYIPFNTFVVKAELLKGITFDERMTYLEDWDFLRTISLLDEFKAKYVDIPVSEYRIMNDSTDTFNPETEKIWEKCRKLIDDKQKKETVQVPVKEIVEYRDFHLYILFKQMERMQQIERNTGYKIWDKVTNRSILTNTLVRLVREIRHLIVDR